MQKACSERIKGGINFGIRNGSKGPDKNQKQKKLLAKVAKEKGYTNLVHFLDDGISGVTMDRPGFVEMIRQLEQG